MVICNVGCSPGSGMSHVTEAGNAYLCVVFGCFRGEKPPLRLGGPPEQSQRDFRRTLAQPRRSAAPPKKNKAVANPVVHPSVPPKLHEHRLGH